MDSPPREPAADPTSTDEAAGSSLRCEAETTVGGTVYRCSLDADHDGKHQFQQPDAETEQSEPSRLEAWQDLTIGLVTEGELEIAELLQGFEHVIRQAMPFQQSPNHVSCPDCEGWGTVFTGSKLPGSETAPCDRCQGAGYVNRATIAPESSPTPTAGPDGAGSYVFSTGDPLRVSPEQGGVAPAPGMAWNPQTGYWQYPETAPAV